MSDQEITLYTSSTDGIPGATLVDNFGIAVAEAGGTTPFHQATYLKKAVAENFPDANAVINVVSIGGSMIGDAVELKLTDPS